MRLLSKIFGHASVTPDWASFFAPEAYALFEQHLRKALAARSLPHGARAVRSGAIMLKDGASLGFGPIARKCHGTEPETWAALIAEHLERALEPDDEVIARLGADFEAARAYLKVQLVPDGFVRSDWKEGLNFRTFGAGIKAALVYDLPTSVQTVPADHVGGWARPAAELFELAAGNVRNETAGEPLVVERVDVPAEHVVLSQLVDDSFFVCSHALWLDRYRDSASERGAFVAIPSRHTVLFHAIRDASAWRAMTSLPLIAMDLHSKLPGPISPNLFWMKDGVATLVPVRPSGEQLQVLPSQAVLDALAGLTEA